MDETGTESGVKHRKVFVHIRLIKVGKTQ